MAAKKERIGFEVGSSFFPFVASDLWKQGDVKLVEEATGYEWDKWCRLLSRHGFDYPPVKQGFFAIAVQRARSLTRDEVVGFLDDLPLIEGIKFIAPAPKAGEGDVPPEGAAETADTET